MLFSLFVQGILKRKLTLKCLRRPHKSYPAAEVVISTLTKCQLCSTIFFSSLSEIMCHRFCSAKIMTNIARFFFVLFKTTAVISDQIIPSIHLPHYRLCISVNNALKTQCYAKQNLKIVLPNRRETLGLWSLGKGMLWLKVTRW